MTPIFPFRSSKFAAKLSLIFAFAALPFLAACSALYPSSPTLPPTLAIPPTITARPLSTFPATYTPAPTNDPPTDTPPAATQAPQTEVTPLPTNAVIGFFNFPADVDPLTGLKVDDPEILDRRPIMVKVSNSPRYSRPQAGLSSADMVFEYYIGYNTNRFLAVFYSQNAKAGPIRSGRLVDAQLMNMYPGFLVYGNADEGTTDVLEKALNKRLLPTKYGHCPPVCGNDTHSLAGIFVDTAGVNQVFVDNKIDNSRPDLHGMIFSLTPPNSNRLGLQVGVQYGNDIRGEWRYDPDLGSYKRWSETGNIVDGKLEMTPDIDRDNQQQLAFDNVVILFADYIQYAPTLHDIRLTQNTHGERALFFRDGLLTEGTWRAPSPNQPLTFYNQYNMPFFLKPGNTWIVFASLQSEFSEPTPTQFELKYLLPYN